MLRSKTLTSCSCMSNPSCCAVPTTLEMDSLVQAHHVGLAHTHMQLCCRLEPCSAVSFCSFHTVQAASKCPVSPAGGSLKHVQNPYLLLLYVKPQLLYSANHP